MSRPAWALMFGAECVFGLQLVSRSRPVRLAGLLAAMLVGMAVAGGLRESLTAAGRLTFVTCGSLMAVAASRVLGTGEARAAARRAAAPGFVHSVARLAGLVLLMGPLVLGSTMALVGTAHGWMPMARLTLVGWGYAGAVGALALMLGPLIGASGAASCGLLLVWLGGIPPSGMQGLLEAWPPVQRPVVWLWNILPLGWRADRLHADGVTLDAVLLGGWVVIGVVVAAWAVIRLPAELGRGAR